MTSQCGANLATFSEALVTRRHLESVAFVFIHLTKYLQHRVWERAFLALFVKCYPVRVLSTGADIDVCVASNICTNTTGTVFTRFHSNYTHLLRGSLVPQVTLLR